MNPSFGEINATRALADPDSVLHHYRRLIALRHDEPAVAHGDFSMLLADHEQVYAFVRRHGDTELLVLANLTSEPVDVDFPDGEHWRDAELLLANVPEPAPLQPQRTLAPWEARIHRRRG